MVSLRRPLLAPATPGCRGDYHGTPVIWPLSVALSASAFGRPGIAERVARSKNRSRHRHSFLGAQCL